MEGFETIIGNSRCFLDFSKTDAVCPSCKHKHEENFYEKELQKSEKLFIYKKCKQCKSKIGISIDMTGDTVCWLKSEEQQSCELQICD